MAKSCAKCGRGGMIVQWRSHSNVATRHKQLINLQARRLEGKKMRVCARCLKTAKYAETTLADK